MILIIINKPKCLIVERTISICVWYLCVRKREIGKLSLKFQGNLAPGPTIIKKLMIKAETNSVDIFLMEFKLWK